MMTDDTLTIEDWIKIWNWVVTRFPDKPWHKEQATAYFNDLSEFDTADVWAALYHLYEQGQRFAPNGSQLVNATIKERRKAAQDNLYRQGLPETSGPIMDWETYTTKRFGEALSVQETIERIHRTMPPCRNRECRQHYEEEHYAET